MKNLVIIGSLCVLALLIGGVVYWKSTDTALNVRGAIPTPENAGKEVSFKILSTGENAKSVTVRKNYAIYDAGEFASFWKKAHGADAKVPSVDFTKNYVIAVFAGTVSSSGYSISVSKITDTESARSVAVVIEEPGEDCDVIEEQTHPFQFVSVEVTDVEALSHTDVWQKKTCAPH